MNEYTTLTPAEEAQMQADYDRWTTTPTTVPNTQYTWDFHPTTSTLGTLTHIPF